MSKGFNHTAHYHPELLRAVPRGCERALDVGCGEGSFARQLVRGHARQVDALDVDPEVLDRARAKSVGLDHLRFIHGDLRSAPLEPNAYDFVCALASLHHLPLAEGVERMKGLLRPGGVLGVIGLYRTHSSAEHLLSALAWPVSRARRLFQPPAQGNVRQREPATPFEEIHQAAEARLPGAVLRRRFFWRYTLIWTRPLGVDQRGE